MNIAILMESATTVVSAIDTDDFAIGLMANMSIRIFPGARFVYAIPMLVERTDDYVLVLTSAIRGLCVELVKEVSGKETAVTHDRYAIVLRSANSVVIDIARGVVFASVCAVEKAELSITAEAEVTEQSEED